MSEAKTTPGPWSVDAERMGPGRRAQLVIRGAKVAGGRPVVAIVSSAIQADREGNASLLAAAPELAQALESIVIRCTEGDPRTDWLPTIAEIARAALRKAGLTP